MNAERAKTEFERLKARKRLVYLVVMGCAFPILLLSWHFREAGDHYLTYVYPAAAGLVLIQFALTWYQAIPQRLLEIASFAFWGTLVLSRLGWHFHAGNGINNQLLILVGGHYWAVAALIIAGFVMLDRRRGLIAGACILLGSAALALSGVMMEQGQVSGESVMFLVRVHVFLLLILALVAAAAGMRDQLQQALQRSDVLDKWANTDMLTNLANRRAAHRLLTLHSHAASKNDSNLSLIIADIDHFKRVNDVHGHAAGDAVIAHTARVFGETVRESDAVARWGGEEFLIIAPGARLDDAMHLAERCRAALATRPCDGLTVTATFGVAEYQAGESIDALLVRADRRLYAGKESGRNQIVGHGSEYLEDSAASTTRTSEWTGNPA